MRLDRVIHARSEVEEENSWSLGSMNNTDFGLDVENMVQIKIRTMEADEGEDKIMLDEAALSIEVDRIGKEMTIQEEAVVVNRDETEHNSKKYVELDRANTVNGNKTEDSDGQLEASVE
ncbi:hypothetical protein SLA2020_034920 [Shorea laevis]